MRIAIVTQLAWKSLPERAASLSERISALLPEKVEIVVVQKPIGPVPLGKDGRVLQSFLKKTLPSDGFDGGCLLLDRSQADPKLGLKGSYVRDGGYLDFWVLSTERAKDKSYFGNYRFERAFAHELLHGLYDWAGFSFPTPDEKRAVPGYDNTHFYDKTTRQIEKGYAEVAAAWPKSAAKTKPAAFGGNADFNGFDPRFIRWSQRLQRAMREIGKPVFVFEAYRSNERQAELYAQGRTKPGKIVTNAKPGESLHNSSRAMDIIFEKTMWSNPKADWELLGMMGKSLAKADGLNVTWGGDWAIKDLPHFDLA